MITHTQRIAAIASIILLPVIVEAQEQNKADSSVKREQSLKEVSVTAGKKAIEVEPGKTIVNVQALGGTAGKNAVELLRKLPGVTVDGQGNISMSGKDGVLVMTDGRQTYLAGTDLTEFLKGIVADDIDRIELMTQPSAKYDATGNAGIINIKLRKLRKRGTNGSATTAYSQSKLYGSVSTLTLNHRYNKANFYSSINYIDASNTVNWKNSIRFLDDKGNVTATSDIHSVPVEVFRKWNVRAGADYSINNKTTAGVNLTGAYYGNTMHSFIENGLGEGGGMQLSIRNTDESSVRRNGSINTFLKHNFNDTSDLNIELNYQLFDRGMSQFLETQGEHLKPSEQLTLRSQMPRHIEVWSVRADYTRALKKQVKIEMGTKLDQTEIDNSGRYDVFTNGSWSYDPSRSNRFLYSEQVGALYVNSIFKPGHNGRWTTQLGLRGEYARIHGLQYATNQAFTRELPAIFPTAYVTGNIDSNNVLEVNYGRRVERPGYPMLNPFNYYTFYNTYTRGNPNLLPQYSHNVEVKHVYKGVLISGIELSYTRNELSNVVVADNNSQTTYSQPVNFGSTFLTVASVTYNRQVVKWWDVMAAAQIRYGRFEGIVNGAVQQQKNIGGSLWCNNQLHFGKWETSCWVAYNSMMAVSPVEHTLSNIYINVGASHKFLGDKLIARLSVDDPFNIYKNRAESIQPGLYSYSVLSPNSRCATLSLTYSFSKGEKTKEQHKGSDDVIQKRF